MTEPTWTARPGKALVIRTCQTEPDGWFPNATETPTPGRLYAYANFEWPEEIGAVVEPATWDPAPECGDGLHGLLWGQGNVGYLGTGSRDDGTAYMVVEVDEKDCVWVHDDKVKFPRCTIVHIGPWHECATMINTYAPMGVQRKVEFEDLSAWRHATYAVNLERIGRGAPDGHAGEYIEDVDERIAVPLGPLSTVFSSEVVDDGYVSDPWDDPFAPTRLDAPAKGMHTVAIDVDHPVRVLPSTTPGHFHLLIDVPMPWWRYRRLLRALMKAGIIEPGYYSASVRRGATFLRLPWVRKRS